jgi:hypothetical protein
MNKTVRLCTLAVLLASGLAISALVIWLQWDFVWEQFRAYALGHAELAATDYGSGLRYSADRVEIHEVSEDGSATNTHRLKINGKDTVINTHAPLLLTGQAADEFLHLWSDMWFGWGLSALCHDPAFVVHFSKGDKTVLKTSLCLSCQNFTVPSIFGGDFLMGFDSEGPKGLAFVEHLKSLFPTSAKWQTAEAENSVQTTDNP